MTPESEGNTPGMGSVDDLPTVSGPDESPLVTPTISGPVDPPLVDPPLVTPAIPVAAAVPVEPYQDMSGSGSTTGGTASQAADEGKQVASHAAEQAQTVAAGAADQSKELLSSAADATKGLVSTAKEEAADLREEARYQIATVMDQATSQLSEQGQAQTERAGQALMLLSDQAQALAEGRVEEAGELGRYAQQASQQLRGIARRLDEGGFQGVLSDTSRFARRRPGAFLLGAAALGLVAGRLGRGVKEAGGSGSSQPAQPSQLVPVASAAIPVAAPPVAAPLVAAPPVSVRPPDPDPFLATQLGGDELA